MQQHHRKRHWRMWIILAPLALLILIVAIVLRPAQPVNDDLPGQSEAWEVFP